MAVERTGGGMPGAGSLQGTAPPLTEKKASTVAAHPQPAHQAAASGGAETGNAFLERNVYDGGAYRRNELFARLPNNSNATSGVAATTTQKPVGEMSAAEKLGEAIKRALPMLPGEVAEELKSLLTPEALAKMAIVVGVWAASHATPIGPVVDALLIAGGAVGLGFEVFKVAEDIVGFAKNALGAQTEADLDRAAEHFAEAVAKVGVNTVAVLLTRKAAGAAKAHKFDNAIEAALKSGNPGRVLEGKIATLVKKDLVAFDKKVGPNGSIGQIDVETNKAIIEVTTATRDKLGQVQKFMSNPALNPTKKPVILYAPNYKASAAQSIRNAGGYVVRTEHELLALLASLK